VNVIVIVIDTLRFDHAGFDRTDAAVHTPRLDELAAVSHVWNGAYCASYPTYPQRTDIVTGRYGDPFNPWRPLRTDLACLPELFSDAGYATQLIHDTPVLVNGGAGFDYPFNAWTQIRGASTDRPYVDNRGFEMLSDWRYDEELDRYVGFGIEDAVGHELVTYIRANRGRRSPRDWNTARLFTEASRIVRENKGRDNLFLWIDCFDPHEPWDAPAEFMKLYDDDTEWDGRMDPRLFAWKQIYMQRLARDEEPPSHLPPKYMSRIVAGYKAKVSHMDHWLGVFLDALDANGSMRDTAIVITADHGTCLGEWGAFGKRVYTHIGEPECHVPLIAYIPGDGRVQHDGFRQPWDIFPTVLRLAGIEVPREADGRDLITDEPRHTVIAGAAPYHGWVQRSGGPLFTVFGPERYMNVAADPAACRLYSYGSEDELSAEEPETVRILWEAAVDKLSEQNAHPDMVDWFRGHGHGEFREHWIGLRPPTGWRAYWGNLYNRWE
jgi:arylsulfatase A-like enzyme